MDAQAAQRGLSRPTAQLAKAEIVVPLIVLIDKPVGDWNILVSGTFEPLVAMVACKW